MKKLIIVMMLVMTSLTACTSYTDVQEEAQKMVEVEIKTETEADTMEQMDTGRIDMKEEKDSIVESAVENVQITPSSTPIAPVVAVQEIGEEETLVSDNSIDVQEEQQVQVETEESKPTQEELGNLETGSQIGDSEFTWGGTYGGVGTGTPTTDGYGDGVDITIEPVN